ncbi:MAG TPA: helix-turn-helix transcriptional regulator [Candidatus Blautia faecigallinarum]|uniref:Helix-turn-helix transcriptional regulator n=1 Tax=Candidatus Blautia faecigallinarum TaxID=2838488 RepID=A0A9D2DQJ0_9FIRM|nr:helix-turn-helix transcriptional regulator [Candidatus Blautia faecigallinarum]
MVRLRILDILKEQQHTKYWLYKQMDMSYQNLSRLLNNETSSIKFENLDKLSTILNCPVGDLFEKIEEP